MILKFSKIEDWNLVALLKLSSVRRFLQVLTKIVTIVYAEHLL